MTTTVAGFDGGSGYADGTYRPDEIEQRNGRILRRGNQNDEVRILAADLDQRLAECFSGRRF